MTPSARANDNFANAVLRVDVALGILGSKSFIRMLVACKDQVCVRGVEVFPKCAKLRVTCVSRKNTAAEERVVPVSQNARTGMRRQILTKPAFLG